jgi:hypothetical protein
MKRAVFLAGVVAWLAWAGGTASASAHAVASPDTQTVPLNGTAAEFDGSGSYSDEGSIYYWAWDFDGDGNDDYSENYNDPWGDGLTTYVYPKAGIFSC